MLNSDSVVRGSDDGSSRGKSDVVVRRKGDSRLATLIKVNSKADSLIFKVHLADLLKRS